MRDIETLLARASSAEHLAADELLAIGTHASLDTLVKIAGQLRDQGHGDLITYSPKVFIPLTMLCRDVCHYCTFARPPRRVENAYLNPEQVMEIARAGERAGCHEALFTLGDKPEHRYKVAREALERLGYETTIDYLIAMCELVLQETSLLPHVNPGVLTRDALFKLRQVSVSQGIMLESASERLCRKGEAHFGSPDKKPEVRLATLRLAGEARIPFTTGILIGIGETREERIDALLKLRELHETYGHIQEVIIQNFRAKPGTKMAGSPEPSLNDLKWTLAMARILFGPAMNIQAPPNLSPGEYGLLIDAGLNDWGGVSPVTPDHVNPEAPWPELVRLRVETLARGKRLVPRLGIYPRYLHHPEHWLSLDLRPRCARAMDTQGFAREDAWVAGQSAYAPLVGRCVPGAEHDQPSPTLLALLDKTEQEPDCLNEDDVAELFAARGADFDAICDAADVLRTKRNANTVSYIVNRNINYTNICYFRCQFCAFSKGKMSENLRGKPYDLDLEEVQRRVVEAWERGATEVCMQGGIHPGYTGNTYLTLCRAVKEVAPGMHIHAFSPLEVTQGAKTLGMPIREFLMALKEAGLGTLPGTAAEILDDEVREILCPDKIRTQEWLDTVEAAHSVGLRTTATVMFGHVDSYRAWSRHLIHLRELQKRTGGINELVPLPFVPMEAPIFRKGFAREGATFREAVLMHAIARLCLDPHITNIQTSWTKMGIEGAKVCLRAGANDLGGTLMNESIARAAGAAHGQELDPHAMERILQTIGRDACQRTTLYTGVPAERYETSFRAAPLAAVILNPATKEARIG